MGENKPNNIPEENKPNNNEQPLNNPSTDEPILPAAETTTEVEQPSTLNLSTEALAEADLQPLNPNMEVHHHAHDPAAPHHQKKNWKNYFWEFLMLFLAVFCGFLAEYQLEHVIEDQREEKFAESLLEDIKKDSIDLAADIPFWENYIKRIDTLRNEIKKPSSQRDMFLLFRCVVKIRYYDNFNYHDRTIQQLKNGGNFRLIRKKGIADSLIDYDSQIQSELRDMEMQSNNIWQNLNFLQDKIFNADFYQLRRNKIGLDSAIKANPEIIKIRTGKEDELFEYYNRLQFFQVMSNYRLGANKGLLLKASSLIEMIKKEYHLQ